MPAPSDPTWRLTTEGEAYIKVGLSRVTVVVFVALFCISPTWCTSSTCRSVKHVTHALKGKSEVKETNQKQTTATKGGFCFCFFLFFSLSKTRTNERPKQNKRAKWHPAAFAPVGYADRDNWLVMCYSALWFSAGSAEIHFVSFRAYLTFLPAIHSPASEHNFANGSEVICSALKASWCKHRYDCIQPHFCSSHYFSTMFIGFTCVD